MPRSRHDVVREPDKRGPMVVRSDVVSRLRLAAALAAAAVLCPAVAAAEPESEPPAGVASAPRRGFHWALGGGGFGAISGPSDWGTAVGLELLPGGPFRRVGLIGLARFDENTGESGMAAGGVVFEAAAARPRLWLSLHAEVGATWGPSQPVAGVGLKSHLMIWGPFAVCADTTAHVVYDGVDSQLAVASTLLLELAR
jgi:hypothetical protein